MSAIASLQTLRLEYLDKSEKLPARTVVKVDIKGNNEYQAFVADTHVCCGWSNKGNNLISQELDSNAP